MNFITQMITQQLAGPVVRQLARRFGVSDGAAEKAVMIAVPLLLAALARNASRPEGAESLHQAVSRDHDGSIFDHLAGYLNDPQSANGAGILGHVLGGQRGAVENQLAQAAGLDPGAAGGILEAVAPLVLGAVGQTQHQQGLDPAGLSQYLGEQQQEAQQQAPDMMSALNGMLDANRDGSVVDDLGRLAAGFFNRG